MHTWKVKYTSLGRVAGIIVVIVCLVALLIVLSRMPETTSYAFNLDQLRYGVPVGTKPRLEREFKLTVSFSSDPATNFDEWERDIQASLVGNLTDYSLSDLWAAPIISGQKYTVDQKPTQLVMRDFYMDTEDDLLLNNALALRLRYRFDNESSLVRHESAPTVRQHYPFRSEIQVKAGRDAIGDGFSVSNEARLEFRETSPPFSSGKTPPPAPWPVEDFLPIVKTGIYDGSVTTPGHLLANSLIDKGANGNIKLEVVLVAISTRTRFHMNMETDYGSGPNPEQAFILSLDRTEIYDGKSYESFLQSTNQKTTLRPSPSGIFYEMEIEFERNISTKLDDVIENQSIEAANLLRDAFLEDQKTIRSLVAELFESRGLETSSMNLSKYQRGRSFLIE